MSDKQHVNTITLWETLTWIPAYVGFWLATSSLVTTREFYLFAVYLGETNLLDPCTTRRTSGPVWRVQGDSIAPCRVERRASTNDWLILPLFSSDILHLDSSGRPLKSFFASPPFVNAATFLVPVAVIASVTTLAVVAQHKYEDVAELYEPLAVTLTKAAAA